MASNFCSYLHLFFSCLILLPLIIPCCQSADPPALQDFCVADLSSKIHVDGYPCKKFSQVTSDDFLFAGFRFENPVFDNTGLNLTIAGVDTYPGLNTLGISMVQAILLPGGAVPLHTHPLSTELQIVVKGKVIIGFVSTDALHNVFYYKTLLPGMMFVVPKGLLHFVLNVGKGKALIYANFDSQNPLFQTTPHALFRSTSPVLDEALRRSFLVNDSVIQLIKSSWT